MTIVREDPDETLNLTSVFSNMPAEDFSQSYDKVAVVKNEAYAVNIQGLNR